MELGNLRHRWHILSHKLSASNSRYHMHENSLLKAEQTAHFPLKVKEVLLNDVIRLATSHQNVLSPQLCQSKKGHWQHIVRNLVNY